MINPELKEYIETNIITAYKYFDKGHDVLHAHSVIERSLKYCKVLQNRYPTINPEIAYTVAAFHDYGMIIERKNHATHSKELVLSDKKLNKFFSKEEILLIAQACEDHSTSSKNPPRSIYGKIVSDADKDTDIKTGLLRGYRYALYHHPEYTYEEILTDLHNEICHRFGNNGVVKYYLDCEDSDSYIYEMRKCANDKHYLSELLLSYIEQENVR